MRLGIFATHPIQYHAPLHRALARSVDLHVYFAHRQSAQEQARAGFNVAFEWDIPLTDGYAHTFLTNTSRVPDVSTFRGCRTPEIADVIARERFDAFLVNGWYTHSFWQAMRACWRTGTPVLVRGDSTFMTSRSLPLRLAKQAVYRSFIPRFDGYLIVGQRAKEYLLHYGADEHAMHFAPHFIDNDFFAAHAAEARADRAALRDRYGVGRDARTFVFAGKLIERKRPVEFVEAVAAVAARHPGVEGVLIGDGPLRAEVEAAIARTGAPARILGFMNQSEIPGGYAVGDAFVLPSYNETWGLVVNEAMACGLPAVVSDVVGCTPDLVDDGQTGYTYPDGDQGALIRAMERSLGLMGTAETERALAAKMQVYSLERATQGVLEAAHAVSAARRRPGGLRAQTA
jgi:glycosyltransferase involved in cell wall biosynthesis